MGAVKKKSGATQKCPGGNCGPVNHFLLRIVLKKLDPCCKIGPSLFSAARLATMCLQKGPVHFFAATFLQLATYVAIGPLAEEEAVEVTPRSVFLAIARKTQLCLCMSFNHFC